MASLIKNQIIKHLSKFARNIKADQIDVKILSGKGELKNIELNELVLTEVLELPTWLRIKRAHCNRVAVKVPWTRLRSSPVQLFIDEIQVEVVLTSEPPVSSGTNPLSSFGDSSYGFADRVVEGLSLYINTLEVHFTSGAFGGSLMLSRLCVESRSPGWQQINDLRFSRILDSATNQILMFKQLTWQLLRIEASAKNENSQHPNINAPLRLITSSGKCRISIKKSSVDGTVLGGRIQTILEDILWVATLPQVRSAIAFYSHLMKLVKAAPPKPKTLHRQTLAKAPAISKTVTTGTPNLASRAFRTFDFEQTSLHLYVGKIDMHLCDDTNASSAFPPDWDIESGALQVTLVRLSIDFYPANVAASERTSWVRYTAPNQCSTWNQKVLDTHFMKLSSLLDANAQSRLKRIWPQLQSQNVVVRIHDVLVQCVTDLSSKREGMFNLFMSDRKSKASLPSDQPLVHLEFASFYHLASETMPLPSNTVHLLLAPFSFLLDQRTIRWIVFVIQDISTAVQTAEASFDVENMPKSDVRIDFLMPKIVVPLNASGSKDVRFPQRLVVSMSTVLVTNCGSLHSQDSDSFFKSLSASLLDFVDGVQLPFDAAYFRNFLLQLNQSALTQSERDEERFWVSTSPIWVDTDYGESTQSTPLLGDVALHAVIGISLHQINIAVQPQCRLRVFLDHFQLLQLTRFFTSISLFADQLEADRKFFCGEQQNGASVPVPIALLLFVDQVQANLLLSRAAIPSPYEAITQSAIAFSISPIDRVESEASLERPSSAPLLPKTPAISLSNQKEFESFPEFPQLSDYDAGSNLDETMSIATNMSDDDQRFIVLETQEDDVFNNADVAVAEEAIIVEEQFKTDQLHQAELAKHVNVLGVSLSSINALVSIANGTTIAEGSSLALHLSEEFDVSRRDIYSSNAWEKEDFKEEIKPNGDGDVPLKFRFFSSTDGSVPSLKLRVRGLNASFSDEIVEHLSPFALDEDKVVVPFYLNVKVSDARIIIKDSKGAPPLRIKLSKCVIEQGEETPGSDQST